MRRRCAEFGLNEDGVALLLGELDHRIRDLFTMIEAAVKQTHSTNIEDYRAKLMARITGLYSFCEFASHYSHRLGLAWISTDRNWPHKTPSRMPIFRVLSHRCCDAKGYADNPIALRLLAHRLCDSGHFRDPRGEKRLRTGVYPHTDFANGHRRILESCESLSDLDVRAVSLRGNPR